MHLSLPTVVTIFSFVLVGFPHGVRLLEEEILFHDEDGNVRGGFGRVKRETVDTASLVADIKFSRKKNLTITALSEEEKEYMLHAHNSYRSLVQPLAADMLEVTWDDEIAAYAQEWANECSAEHRTNRDLDPWINMGENLYWWFSGRYHEGEAVKWWWDETQFYTYNTKACVPNELCGHYITMAWAKTAKIGCGVARCHRLTDLPDIPKESYYFVCNYNGRFVSNIKPYIATDTPCSSCHTTDYPKCRYNLCVTQDMIDNDIGYDGDTTLVGLNRTETYSSPKSSPSGTSAPEQSPATAAPQPGQATDATDQPTQQPAEPATGGGNTAQPTQPATGSGNTAQPTQPATGSGNTAQPSQPGGDTATPTTASSGTGASSGVDPDATTHDPSSGLGRDSGTQTTHLNSLPLVLVSLCLAIMASFFLRQDS